MSKYEDYAFDIECLPNLFTCITHRISDGARWTHIITPWLNQGREFNYFLNQIKHNNGRQVGYNNLAYDYPIIHLIMSLNGIVNNQILYAKSMSIINSDFNDYSHTIWDNDRFIPQLDLMKVHHFDNSAKRTSLKLLEFNMRMKTIEELELDFNQPVTPDQVPVVLKYNDHDVDATVDFYHETKEHLKFRDQLTEKYGKDFSNYNDTKIGQEIVLINLAKRGIKANKYTQTIRTHIKLDEIIFPYIQFERPEFNAVLKLFKSAVMNPETLKGYFGSRNPSESKCREVITHDMAQYMEPKDIKVYYADGEIGTYDKLDMSKPITKLVPINIHVIVNGFRFDFGAGGIHGSVDNEIVIPGDDEELKDTDVASYYPNLGIKNRLYPLHLGEGFCDTMDEMFHERLKDKKSVMGNAYKLGMNGSYGKSNDKHSPFYDPQYTMSITINGQLLLCMMAEQLMKIPGLRLIQVNTDGLTYLYPKQYAGLVQQCSDWWESLTRLEFEHVLYQKMCIANVNSYIAVTQSGKVKRIGAYAYERASENPGTRELPWHKDHSAIVVAKAAEAALVRNENIRGFIMNHLKTDPLDFMLRTKINRSDNLLLETPVMWGDVVMTTQSTKCQRVTRYYVSKDGGYLMKYSDPTANQIEAWKKASFWKHQTTGVIKKANKQPSKMWDRVPAPTPEPPRNAVGIDAGYKVTIANDLTGLDMSNIDFDYYVDRTRKLVDPLLRGK